MLQTQLTKEAKDLLEHKLTQSESKLLQRQLTEETKKMLENKLVQCESKLNNLIACNAQNVQRALNQTQSELISEVDQKSRFRQLVHWIRSDSPVSNHSKLMI